MQTNAWSEMNEIRLRSLFGDRVFEDDIDLDLSYIICQLMRIMLHNKNQKPMVYKHRATQSVEVSFCRIYKCQVYSELHPEDDGTICYMMVTSNTNTNLFKQNFS